MDKVQSFGAALVVIGFFLLIVFPILGILVGERLIEISLVGGWVTALIGAGIIVVSLVFERLDDMKKENF